MPPMSTNEMPFMKMHGLGNDFVVLDARADSAVLDARAGDVAMTVSLAQALADRNRGVGFDQLAVMSDGAGDIHLTFYNADGSTAAACGNAGKRRCTSPPIAVTWRRGMKETG